jgi:hypothetical protein
MIDSIDICISFDTTGSMYPCLTQVRRSIKETAERLYKDIPDLRIGLIAHGDYCDANDPYVTRLFDFSVDVKSVEQFINSVQPTYGGDAPECYELVLLEARTQMKWQSGRAKVLVMIGDDVPHGPNYPQNIKRIDWRNELGLLLEAGVNVYGIHCMPGIRRHSKPFYQEIAKTTGGFYLTLDQFSNITDLLMGICYRQDSENALNDFATEIEKEGKLNKNLRQAFITMLQDPRFDSVEEVSREYTYVKDGIQPVPAGRFQVIPVDKEATIKDFIQDQGINFKTGRGFYELVRHGKKQYKVQQYKEIILMDRKSGDMFNGKECREMLGLLPQIEGKGAVETLAPRQMEKYRVFIQSTSYTRKLVPGSSLLYEVEDWERL